MPRRILIIIISLIIIAIIAVGIWWFLFRAHGGTVNLNLGNKPSNNSTLFPVASNQNNPTSNQPAPGTVNTNPNATGQGLLPEAATTEVVSGEAIAGMSSTPNGTSTIVYAERASGNVFSRSADGQTTRLSNVTVPQVIRAVFGFDKTTIVAILQSMADDQLKNTLLVIRGTTTTASVLSDNIYALTINPSKNQWFYLTEQDGLARGFVANVYNQKPVVVFTSPLLDWRVAWPSPDTILVYSKPGNGLPGYAYTINPQTKKVARLLGGVSGLNILISPDGKYLLVNESQPAVFNSFITNPSGTIKEPLSANLVPEKCLWATNQRLICAVPKLVGVTQFPDSWYRGEISLKNDLWQFDLSINKNQLTISSSLLTTDLGHDAVNLLLPNNHQLFFIDQSTQIIQSVNLRSNF